MWIIDEWLLAWLPERASVVIEAKLQNNRQAPPKSLHLGMAGGLVIASGLGLRPKI